MTHNYRDKLFESYNKTHVAYIDIDDQTKIDWFLTYSTANYLQHIDKYDRNTTKILEIGCNKGYMLLALRSFGFKNLSGVDLSPDDVEKAKIIVPDAEIICIDAVDYLENNQEQFDIIILKAVLEHIRKDDIIPFLETIKAGLKPNGSVIIDVPNMDWIFAQHERYMDFTHEVGFTRESLAQVMRNVFSETVVTQGQFTNLSYTSIKGKITIFLRPLVIYLLHLVFSIIGEGASSVWWYSRSIIGIAKR